MNSHVRVGVVGLGYVGLPLAVAFSRKYRIVGFDISTERVRTLKEGVDYNGQINPEELGSSTLEVTGDAEELRGCDILIVTVPTPVDESCRPDFSHLSDTCNTIGAVLSKGAIVVFESTVYPGATEEICVPILEAASGLTCGKDFKVGYSPERINPGDTEHPFEKITKVVAGQDVETLDRLAELYGSIVEAGIHKVSSIKVAEAAKVIENTQRDINIALMNEISKICDLIGIRTSEVLTAAGTKWNFVRFHPGLVGGHCIGVDPYYLTAKAEQLGYHPEVILSGRRINDSMGSHIAQRLVKMLADGDRSLRETRVGILGLTFKENVPDIRNSKVKDICLTLSEFGIRPIVHDPLADKDAVKNVFGIELCDLDEFTRLDAVVYAVSHTNYVKLGTAKLQDMLIPGGIIFDVKSVLSVSELREDVRYWSL